MGSNQRMEFLGDTVLQLVTSDYLYKHFPEHHEGHLSLLRHVFFLLLIFIIIDIKGNKTEKTFSLKGCAMNKNIIAGLNFHNCLTTT